MPSEVAMQRQERPVLALLVQQILAGIVYVALKYDSTVPVL